MAATAEDIRGWVNDAKKKKKVTHLVVVCDTFDWEDYPVEVKDTEDINDVIKKYHGPNMQKIMEIYSMKMELEKQLAEHRSWHPDHK